jgi:hypothetical protein
MWSSAPPRIRQSTNGIVARFMCTTSIVTRRPGVEARPHLSRGEALTQPLRESGIGPAFETVLFPRRYGQPNLGFVPRPMGVPRLCACSHSFSRWELFRSMHRLPEGRISNYVPRSAVKRQEWRMSGLRKRDQHLIQQDPLYDASGSLRKRSMSPLTPSRDTRSEPFSSSASFNNHFETAASEGRSDEFEPEMDRRMTLTGVATRLAAAIGISALVALFLAIAVPDLPHQKDRPKTALSEFQPFLASVGSSQSTTSERSEKLLQRFMQ